MLVVVSPKGDWTECYESGMPKKWHDENGDWIAHPDGYYDNIDEPNPGYRMVKTILTISHQDHDPTNNDPSNLKSLCQRCHLRQIRDGNPLAMGPRYGSPKQCLLHLM